MKCLWNISTTTKLQEMSTNSTCRMMMVVRIPTKQHIVPNRSSKHQILIRQSKRLLMQHQQHQEQQVRSMICTRTFPSCVLSFYSHSNQMSVLNESNRYSWKVISVILMRRMGRNMSTTTKLQYVRHNNLQLFRQQPNNSQQLFDTPIALAVTAALAALISGGTLATWDNNDNAKGWSCYNHRHITNHNTKKQLIDHNPNVTQCVAKSSLTEKQRHRRKQLLRNRQTVRKMEEDSCHDKLENRYYVNWTEPLGEGSFGVVYLGINQLTEQRVAVKKISKKYTGAHDLQREIHALLHLRDAGGHPNICSLRETFSEDGYYYLILDLIEGCEMFDHLVSQGAYSEADAARLVREVASALAFLHGGPGLVHCDLKPENLMLSSHNASNAVIKLIDFGCAVVIGDEGDDDNALVKTTGRTLAYCPPEILTNSVAKIDPAVDMWALGVIIYIMLTGLHPFDLSGQSSDEEVAHEIVQGKPPPLRNSAITAHLSDSAIDLIDQLMQTDPQKRITADQMLEHPWTRGLTANQEVMVGSDKKLSMYRMYKSGIAEKVFQNIITWSDDHDNPDVSRRTSLIERSFRAFDPQQKGYLTQNDLQAAVVPNTSNNPQEQQQLQQQKQQSSTVIIEPNDHDSSRLSLSGFSDLLAENMKNRYFPKGSIVYREGDLGNAMYFINSGTISVETLGSVVKRGPGDFFGEGALLSPTKLRSATIRCDTPVHAMEISREYFEKYLAKSDSGLLLTLREKDKIRKRNRSKMILRSQPNLIKRHYKAGERIFEKGDNESNSLYLVENGNVNITEDGQHVFTATPSNLFGESSIITGRPRDCSAYCSDGCILLEMLGDDFISLTKQSPDIMKSLRDLSIRRDFKKAVVRRLQKEFPYDNPREAFDAVKQSSEDSHLRYNDIASLMRELHPEYTHDEIIEIIRVLALQTKITNHNNNDTNTTTAATSNEDDEHLVVSFDEFKKVFVADIRLSASV